MTELAILYISDFVVVLSTWRRCTCGRKWWWWTFSTWFTDFRFDRMSYWVINQFIFLPISILRLKLSFTNTISGISDISSCCAFSFLNGVSSFVVSRRLVFERFLRRFKYSRNVECNLWILPLLAELHKGISIICNLRESVIRLNSEKSILELFSWFQPLAHWVLIVRNVCFPYFITSIIFLVFLLTRRPDVEFQFQGFKIMLHYIINMAIIYVIYDWFVNVWLLVFWQH